MVESNKKVVLALEGTYKKILSFVKNEGIVSKVTMDEIANNFMVLYKDEINAKEMNNSANENFRTWNITKYRH